MKITINSQYNTTNSNVSFKGLTHCLKNRIFNRVETYHKIKNANPDKIIGTLPKEIIKDIIKISKTPQEKNTAIKTIIDGFNQASSIISKLHKKQSKIRKAFSPFKEPKVTLNNKIKNIWTNFKNSILIFNKKSEADLIENLYFTPTSGLLSPNDPELLKACKQASKILTKNFQKAGLLDKNFFLNKASNSISIKILGGGNYGRGYAVIFPEKTKYSPKVLKVFYPTFSHSHGLLAEINAAKYIENINGQKIEKLPFVDVYFGSIKDNYLLSELAQNYKRIPNQSLVLGSLITCNDTHYANIINGRIIDYGAIKSITSKLSKTTVKSYKKIAQAYVRSKETGQQKHFIKTFNKIMDQANASKTPDSNDILEGIRFFHRTKTRLDNLVYNDYLHR